MSAVICLHASAQVSGSEVCVNLGGLPEWVKSSATSAPNTFVYLLLLNALIGLLFNMAKLVQLFGPVCEVIIIFRNLFTSEDTPDNYGPDFVVTDELLTKTYFVAALFLSSMLCSRLLTPARHSFLFVFHLPQDGDGMEVRVCCLQVAGATLRGDHGSRSGPRGDGRSLPASPLNRFFLLPPPPAPTTPPLTNRALDSQRVQLKQSSMQL